MADSWYTSFQSVNYPNRLICYQNELGELGDLGPFPIDAESDGAISATFYLVPGLADNRLVSFQPAGPGLNGYYFRHQDFRLKLQVYNAGDKLFEEDATFSIVPSLANSYPSISFRSYNYPDRFIRHRDFHLWVESYDREIFNYDASFTIIQGVANIIQ